MAFKFSIELPIERLVKANAESKTAAALRITRATRESGKRLQEALRQQVRAAGLGSGLEKAWRVEDYPKGERASLHPASLVYSKAIALHRAFDSSATVSARGGQYLAIPLPEAIKRGWDRAFVDRKGGALTGAAMPRRFSQTATALREFGELRFVALGQGRALLVADPPKAAARRVKNAGARRQAAEPAGVRGVPLFLLVRQVRVKKLLDFDGAAATAGAQFNSLLRAVVNSGAA